MHISFGWLLPHRCRRSRGCWCFLFFDFVVLLTVLMFDINWTIGTVSITCKISWKSLNSFLLSSDGFQNVYLNTTISDDLARKVKIFCFVLSTPKNRERAEAVNATWLRRCTGSMFVSSSPLSFKNTLIVDVPDGRKHLTAKTFAAFQYLFENYLEDYDWFLKGDDDVFIILENLRLFLSHLSPDSPSYVGHHFRVYVHDGYMSGGASYVLSKEALRRFGERGIAAQGGLCSRAEYSEDIAMGQCMEVLAVPPIRTTDVFGRQSFFPNSLECTLFDDGRSSNINYSQHLITAGRECCSQLSIAFHYTEPRMMYLMEMLLYRVSVYGRHGDDLFLRTSVFKPNVERIDHKDEKEIFYPN